MASGVDFLDAYVRGVIDDEIDELFAQLPALLLDGPKGVGKTATATQRCRSVRRLDVASERETVEADPAIIVRYPAPLLIDEWQRVPVVFDAVRRLSGRPRDRQLDSYIELLTALRVLGPIPAFIPSNNHLNALTGAPKHHLADPALAARLVTASATRLLTGANPSASIPRDGTFFGGLFESLAALSVRTLAQSCDARVSHLRTNGGHHEVDFIVGTDDGVVAFEVEMSAAVNDAQVSHLQWLRHELGDDCIEVIVLNTGPEAYRRSDGVAVVPLALLVP